MKKELQVSDTPDKWVILKTGDIYKVFATWAGGYLGNDSWRLNSGISAVHQDKDYYYFEGFSGSCYKCHKKAYGVVAMYNKGALQNILKEEFVTLLEDQLDWQAYLEGEV